MNNIFNLETMTKVNKIKKLTSDHINKNNWLRVESCDPEKYGFQFFFEGLINYKSEYFVIFQTKSSSKEYLLDLTKEKIFFSNEDQTENAIIEIEKAFLTIDNEDLNKKILENRLKELETSDKDPLSRFELIIRESEGFIFTGLKNGTEYLNNIHLLDSVDIFNINVENKKQVVTASFLIPIIEHLKKLDIKYIETNNDIISREINRAINRLIVRSKIVN